MIKYFCDKCGKETNGTHICKECELKELTCGFKVGDKVVTSTGEVGHIDWICDCDQCKERGIKLWERYGVPPVYEAFSFDDIDEIFTK